MDPQPTQKLYIGNLSFEATEDDVRQLFATYGEVKDVKVVSDRYTGRPRGFAFVEMATADGANSAKKSLDGQQFHGRDLSVDFARAREPGSRGPGGGGDFGRGGGDFGGGRGGGFGRGDRGDRGDRGGDRRGGPRRER